MKRILSFVLVLALFLSLSACGEKNTLSVDIVEKEFDGLDDIYNGTLFIDASDGIVKEFTYVLKDINGENLLDRTFVNDAVTALVSGDANITSSQMNTAKILPLFMSIELLLVPGEEDLPLDNVIEKMLDSVCDGKKVKYEGGWTVISEVDQEDNTLTITAYFK